MTNKVRVRFAPSPTGGLHLGGIRTVLYNYLFAKKHGGDFILRIEDTDQSRFVPGAEEYILQCLAWCGLQPDESVQHGGEYGPYRQSERKDLYKKYAEQLVANGHAYYAFDTTEELEAMRERLKAEGKDSLQYDHQVRDQMINSLALSAADIEKKLASGIPYVIRIKVPANETISFSDLIRGEINFDSNTIDDKVLLKADGMPTYHLAVVVDDYLMKITHAFRGEEWLPSAPVHILLWQYLFGLDAMPQWAHLPLILKPDGHGKLSKRDGERLGFPVYALGWQGAPGFKEEGFLPEAFLNLLAVLGWNDGTEQEIYSLQEMIEKFSLDHVHVSGAKFDYEKAKWFNHEWIKNTDASKLLPYAQDTFQTAGIAIPSDEKLSAIIDLVKERCALIPQFVEQAGFFVEAPKNIDVESIKGKWNEEKKNFFTLFMAYAKTADSFTAADLETNFKDMAAAQNIKPGELQLPLRVMLVGGKFGPGVFEIAAQIGAAETAQRIEKTLSLL